MAGAGSSSVSLTYTADIKPMIADLKKGLASVSGMTEAEARKWAKSVDDSFKKIAKSQQGVGDSAKDAGKNVQGMGSSLRMVGTQMPDVVTQLSGGADAMQVLTQQGLQVVQQMAATGVSMTAILGPVAAVAAGVGALGAAYAAITGPIEREIEAQKALAAINRSTEATHRKLESAYIDQAVALGALTEAEGRQMRAQDAARQAVLDFAEAQQDQRKEIADTIESSKTYLKWTERLLAVYSTVAPDATREAINAITGWDDAVKSGEAQLQGLNTALVTTAEQQRDLRNVTLETAEATDKHTAAIKRNDEGLKRTLEWEEELRRRMKERTDAQIELAGIAAAHETSEAPRLDAIIQRRDMELARVDELVAITGGLAAAEEARAAITMSAMEDEAKVRAESIETLEKRQDAAHEKELKQIQQRRAAYLQAGDTIAGSLATVGEALQNIEGATEDQRMAAFRAMKGIAIAQAAINTAQAITAALTLPPPLGEIAAVAVGAAGAAQVAVIAATEPSFHQGGVDFGLAPDEIRTQRKTSVEGTLTGRGVRAVGGPAAVEAANKGQAPGGGGAPRVIAVLTPPGAPARLLRDATRSRAGAALVQDAARPSALRVRR